MKTLFKFNIAFLCILITFQLDAQDNWQAIGPADIPIFSFGVNEPYLFAGGNCNEGGIFLSTDYGDSWAQTNIGLPGDGTDVRSIAIGDTSILAGISFRGMYVSTDTAEIWDMVATQGAINTIVFADAPWHSILAAGNKIKGLPLVLISDEGSNWLDISDGLPVSFPIQSLMVRNADAYAGTFSGVYRLNIGAIEWEPSNTGMTNADIRSLGQTGLYLFAGSSRDGVYRSADGTNWIEKNTGLEIVNTTFGSFAFHGSNIFVAASGDHGGVYQSKDNGETWFEINTGFPGNSDVNAVTIAGTYIYAGTNETGVYRRSLSGLTSIDDIGDEDFNNKNLFVYPNPGSGKFTLTFSSDPTKIETFKPIEVFCYTQLGQLVFQKEYVLDNGELKTDLDFSNLSNGIYTLHVRHHDKSIFKKLIIK